jgi:DNA-binding transcriptional regulator YiaG
MCRVKSLQESLKHPSSYTAAELHAAIDQLLPTCRTLAMHSSLFAPTVPTAEEIRELRKRAGLSQKRFAQLLLTSVDRIKKYENGTYAMNATMWFLARISCDSRFRALWIQSFIKAA